MDGRGVVRCGALERQGRAPQQKQGLRLMAQARQPFYHVRIFLVKRFVRQQHGRVGQVVGHPQQGIIPPIQHGRVPIQRGIPVPPVGRSQTAHRHVHAAQRRAHLSRHVEQHLIEQLFPLMRGRRWWLDVRRLDVRRLDICRQRLLFLVHVPLPFLRRCETGMPAGTVVSFTRL